MHSNTPVHGDSYPSPALISSMEYKTCQRTVPLTHLIILYLSSKRVYAKLSEITNLTPSLCSQ